MSDWQTLVTTVSSIPVAALSSWLTVKLALRRFKSEKWFEKRIDAYTNVIESLHLMKHCCERQLGALERGRELPHKIEDDLINAHKDGVLNLRKFTDMGALLFSIEAINTLDSLKIGLENAAAEEWEQENLNAEILAITKALTQLRIIAKRDLNA